MKKFRDYITEEVVPTALVKDGSIDIDKEEVRASINMALAKVTADSSITPYIALNRISKALSLFHIILPKRVYLEGSKGVEVHEIRQFGDKMGMNDQGEFVNEVQGKYYLFIQYGMNTPMGHGGQYACPTMGGTFRVMAKVVDQSELDRLISMAELSLAEEMNAETQQARAKMAAPKEDPHTALGDCDCSQGNSPSTKSAIKVMMKKKIDEGYGNTPSVRSWGHDPLSGGRGRPRTPVATKGERKGMVRKSDQDSMKRRISDRLDKHTKPNLPEGYELDEVSLGKLVRYKNKAGEGREKGVALADKKMKGNAKVNASMPKNAYMEEEMTKDERRKWVLDQIQKGKEEKKRLRKSLRAKPQKRQPDGTYKEETQIDEVSAGLARRAAHSAYVKSDKMKKDAQKEPDMHSYVQAFHKGEKKNKQGIKFAKYAANKMEESQIDEKAPPGAKFERMVKHIKKGYSKDGLTKKEKGIAYATAWKAKKREESE